ncbi:hypothetical protein BKA66DRAFT_432179 [Pyrenochaeta sp. MPI-SDFR-AT-0127]|nr:hypothetical protein BKA66DRAFT_432179 [Pyrenochaeta sp. MPI-SDFR-AT-0127]
MKLDQLEKISSSGESPQEHTNIWEQHALHMQQRYLATGLPNFAIETKLAFQKKAFDTHLNRESQLRKAYEDTANLPLDCIRKGVTSTWNTVLVTTQFSEHSMWELSSTQLWRYFSGGISWNLPQWVPRGILRIETMSSSSRIFFDFGARIFSTRHVSLPSTCSTHSFFTHAKCHETGADVTFGIAFLAGGFVEVHFPAEVIVKPDSGCNVDTIVETVVGLTGLYVGPVA